MGFPTVNSGCSSGSARPEQSAGPDARIRALEQKLHKLNTERQKAIRRRDEERKKKLEAQIRVIEAQLRQCRQAERERANESGRGARKTSQNPPEAGKYIDVYA